MEIYENNGVVEQLFRTTFKNGWHVSIIAFNDLNASHSYELMIQKDSVFEYEDYNSPKAIFRRIAEVQNW